MEPDTTLAAAEQTWRSLVSALPGDLIGLVDPDGRMVTTPDWLEPTTSPWSSRDDLFEPLNEADRTRVRDAVSRAQTGQGQATTVARLADSGTWSLLSFLDATGGRNLDGIVVAWVPSLDEPEAPADRRVPVAGPLHGPWLGDVDDRPDHDTTGWIDDELGAAIDLDDDETSPTTGIDVEPVAIALEIEDLPVPAAFLDHEGAFAVANRRWYQLLGLTVGEGASWLDLFETGDIVRLEALAASSSEVDTTVRLLDADGAHRWIRIQGLSRPEARGAGGLWILDDVTDNVTLVGTVAELERQVADGQDDEDEGTTAAVLVVGIEGLSTVRNAHGEAAADLVLTATGERLRNVLRPHDHVGQLASDEFAVVCTRMRGGDGALSIADRILHELESPFEIGDDEFSLSTSIGVAVTDDPGRDPSSLLSDATAARNDARRRGVSLATVHGSG